MTREQIKAKLAEFDRRPRRSITDREWEEIGRLEAALAKVAPKRSASNVWRAGDPIPDAGWAR